MTPSLNQIFAQAGVYQPEDTIGFLLWRVAHRHQRECDRIMGPLGLTHLQFVVLVQAAWLGRDGSIVTQPALMRHSNIHAMQLSSVLKALEAKSLVERPRCPANARIKRIVLTGAAIDLLALAVPQMRSLQATFFGADEALGAELHARLRHVVTGWGDDT